MNSIVSENHLERSEFVKKMYSIYQENKDLVLMGGYTQGQNNEIDKAIESWPKICELIKQNFKERSNFDESVKKLESIN